MQRYAQVIRLRPEHQAAYVDAHKAANAWPQVTQTILDCNIRNYSIFLRNGMLFGYFEYHGTDFDADMAKMAADPETQRWWSLMDPMQEILPDALPGEKWSMMEEVYHLDETTAR